MQVVYKFDIPLTNEFTLELPHGAQFVSAQMQKGKPKIWFRVNNNPGIMKRTHRFCFYGTGVEIPGYDDLNPLGTLQSENGDYAIHLFERV